MKPAMLLNADSQLRRKSRRRMAWIALYSMLGFMVLLLFVVPDKRIESLSSIIDTFFFCMSSIILGYTGAATWDSANLMKHKEKMNDKETCDDKVAKHKIDNPDEEK